MIENGHLATSFENKMWIDKLVENLHLMFTRDVVRCRLFRIIPSFITIYNFPNNKVYFYIASNLS